MITKELSVFAGDTILNCSLVISKSENSEYIYLFGSAEEYLISQLFSHFRPNRTYDHSQCYVSVCL